MSKEAVSSPRFLRWKQVQDLVPISRSQAHRLAAKEPPEFPKPIKIGDRASAWLESEVKDWIEEKISKSH